MASKEANSLLVITLSNIGDVILTTPVVTSLRTRFPDAHFTVVAGPKAAPVLQGSRLIDRLLIYDKFAGWAPKWGLFRKLRERSYDYVVDLRNTVLPFLVKARHRSPFFRARRGGNARDEHLRILELMKLPKADGQFFDFFSEEDERRLLEKLKKKAWVNSGDWVVAAPGAGDEAKRWPLEGFREVVTGLLKISALPVVVAGDQNERELGAGLATVDPRRIFNLTGETTIREAAALVSRAKLVLTNDSAMMHLGYELHRPVVAIFGPTDPRRYGRESQIWRLIHEPCLRKLSPERVFQSCQELLNETCRV